MGSSPSLSTLYGLVVVIGSITDCDSVGVGSNPIPRPFYDLLVKVDITLPYEGKVLSSSLRRVTLQNALSSNR